MKKTLWIIVVLVVLVAAFFALKYKAPEVSAPTADQANDTASAITNDLGSIDIGDIDQEFKSIDDELNSL